MVGGNRNKTSHYGQQNSDLEKTEDLKFVYSLIIIFYTEDQATSQKWLSYIFNTQNMVTWLF